MSWPCYLLGSGAGVVLKVGDLMAEEDDVIDPDDEVIEEDELESDDLDVPDLDEEDLEDDVVGEDLDDELDDSVVVDVDEEDEDDVPATTTRRRVRAGEDEDEDDDDILSPDDVEADLDRILKDRMVASDEDAELEEEDDVVEERTDPGDRLQPKRPDEVLCSSCFLLVRSTAPGCPVADDDCPIFTS
jgi:hypothetical protein